MRKSKTGTTEQKQGPVNRTRGSVGCQLYVKSDQTQYKIYLIVLVAYNSSKTYEEVYQGAAEGRRSDPKVCGNVL